jgi:phage host-nuclease inhibitor protein Gam
VKMDDHNDEWAKPENPEVEAGKDAFAEAQQAEDLRRSITERTTAAVKYGHVDRDWANGWLDRLGVELVTGEAQYKINVPIVGSYGTTVTATSRTEALEKFNQYAAKVAAAGQVTDGQHCQGVYNIELVTGAEPVFFSGPQDPDPQTPAKTPGLDALKDGIRQMLKQGVTEQGWGITYAADALDAMGLPPLPLLEYRTVNVPVSGTAQVTVAAFVGDEDEKVQRVAAGAMRRTKQVVIEPDEIGTAFASRPDTSEAMGLKLIDED